MNECPFKIGDVLERVNSFGLAGKLRVTEVTPAYFKADVLEGENTRDPIKVLRAGWFLYAKTSVPVP